ncbi:MAG: c-type cytochrome [Coleofasciculaceae cyanobacterium SM2_3_26]|nr:c-type cytochrome [Coleofasciculaceae cyanobacterium SM2_3_26]
MKRTLAIILLAVVTVVLFFANPAIAADAAAGKQIFNNACTQCHMGGGNVVIRNKTLKVDALEKYLANFGTEHNLDAIIYQVTNGKNAMPRFKGRLSTEQIENVAAYVLEQAEQGW